MFLILMNHALDLRVAKHALPASTVKMTSFSSIKNVCAKGSLRLVKVLDAVTVEIINLLVDVTVACLVSNTPDDVNGSFAIDVEKSSLGVLISSSLNSRVPVLNLIASVLGIKNEPVTEPSSGFAF